jgi:hypothetical protein
MQNLPVKKRDEFLAEVESMDLSKIKDNKFLVAVATGDPDSVKFLCSTIRGPYEFTEMLQEVAEMWNTHQHHARVVVCERDNSKRVRTLDANTVDYIECKANDIIMEEMIAAAQEQEFTCQAGLVEEEE